MEEKKLNDETLKEVSGGGRSTVYYYIKYKVTENGDVKSIYESASYINGLQGSSTLDKIKTYCNNHGWIFVSYKAI